MCWCVGRVGNIIEMWGKEWGKVCGFGKVWGYGEVWGVGEVRGEVGESVLRWVGGVVGRGMGEEWGSVFGVWERFGAVRWGLRRGEGRCGEVCGGMVKGVGRGGGKCVGVWG